MNFDTYNEEVYSLLKEMCAIPAPSHHEEKRAEYCKAYFDKLGFDKVYIDGALNVVCEWNCEGSNAITVFAAHTDTVFPDTEPMPFYEKDGKAYCPGVCDDTASVAILMVAAKLLKSLGIAPKNGFLFVANSCEEGLGNLKGTRELMKNYEGRISAFLSFDSTLDVIHDACVGSHRYEVEVLTEGGHSFGAFGNENAIANLAKIVAKIYEIQVPKLEGAKTTYNVGSIEGGTSVNTIAQSAKMLCEYRSDNVDCLDYMKERFEAIFKEAANDKVTVNVTLVGDRPCSRMKDPTAQITLSDNCKAIIEKQTGVPVTSVSASTDCNVPLSLGIPSVAVGVWMGDGFHTREEWLEIESLKPGLRIAIDLMKNFL